LNAVAPEFATCVKEQAVKNMQTKKKRHNHKVSQKQSALNGEATCACGAYRIYQSGYVNIRDFVVKSVWLPK